MSVKQVAMVAGVAPGPRTACRLKRVEPECDVTLIDQDQFISYHGCETLYFISAEISDVDELIRRGSHKDSTPEIRIRQTSWAAAPRSKSPLSLRLKRTL